MKTFPSVIAGQVPAFSLSGNSYCQINPPVSEFKQAKTAGTLGPLLSSDPMYNLPFAIAGVASIGVVLIDVSHNNSPFCKLKQHTEPLEPMKTFCPSIEGEE